MPDYGSFWGHFRPFSAVLGRFSADFGPFFSPNGVSRSICFDHEGAWKELFVAKNALKKQVFLLRCVSEMPRKQGVSEHGFWQLLQNKAFFDRHYEITLENKCFSKTGLNKCLENKRFEKRDLAKCLKTSGFSVSYSEKDRETWRKWPFCCSKTRPGQGAGG